MTDTATSILPPPWPTKKNWGAIIRAHNDAIKKTSATVTLDGAKSITLAMICAALGKPIPKHYELQNRKIGIRDHDTLLREYTEWNKSKNLLISDKAKSNEKTVRRFCNELNENHDHVCACLLEALNTGKVQSITNESPKIPTASPQPVVDEPFEEKPHLIPDTPKASDLAEPDLPERALCQISRILRDTQMARNLKSQYNNTCQLCGTSIAIPGGLFYSEAHHIKPLGGDHHGPDVASNIIIVCPNCHARLDYGAIPLALEDIHHQPGHEIDPVYVDYHNQKIFNQL